MPQTQELTVGLRFTADTSAAKRELDSLKTSLMGLNSLKTVQFGQEMTKGISEATIAASKLKTQLDAATNIKTGNLDLTKFSRQLKQSGTSLEYYRKQLQSIGPEGQQAFMQLASSIQSSEVPLLRINKLFTGLWENLKRTAGWQFSSTAIHAVIGAVQKAYGYAQDLNRSLNDIRIVTGQSADQMARFAEVANRSAKALSTTTNEYVKASLIYYQQGLSDSEVQARTDITEKMANVTRESAETVSDQMTAVWNNFAKGGENLESFADKMVALGAATASSSDEIAQGLEKFAAVADTVGLSFDYAAAALTTITATTRQSADTVGTALKTLFARMEGLKLGETLDDGTDLNKYSEALASIGVNIKDANGELKGMDAILDETMVKWKTLSKDQQVALAQTVAGVRQYTQFVALMDNADFFKENLTTEANADGALQEQANIYAESWEAAQKRVKAATESLYGDLINDEFFIHLTNNIGKIIEFIDKLIRSLGGMPGLLSAISTLVFSIAGETIANRLRDMSFSLSNLMSKGSKVTELKGESTNQVRILATNTEDPNIKDKVESYKNINELQQIITKNAKHLNDTELQEYKTLVQIQEMREKENQLIQQSAREKVKNKQEAKNEFTDALGNSSTTGEDIILKQQKAKTVEIEQMYKQLDQMDKAGLSDSEAFDGLINKISQAEQELDALTGKYEQADDVLAEFDQEMNNAISVLDQNIEKETTFTENKKNLLDAYDGELDKLLENTDARKQFCEILGLEVEEGASAEEIKEALKTKESELSDATRTTVATLKDKISILAKDKSEEKELLDLLDNLIKKTRSSTQETLKANKSAKTTTQGFQTIKTAVSQTHKSISDYATAITNAARATSGILMGFNSLKGAIDAIKDPNLSGWEKFTSIAMSLSMTISGLVPGITSAISTFTTFGATMANEIVIGTKLVTIEELQNKATEKNIAVENLKNIALKDGAIITEKKISNDTKEALLTTLKTDLTDKEKRAKLAKILVEKEEISQEEAKEIVDKIMLSTSKVKISEILKETGARISHVASLIAEKVAMLASNPVFLAAAAAVALVTVAIMAVVKARDADTESIAKAKAAWERAKKTVEETKQKYDEIAESINKLSDQEDKLKNLEEGTKEWSLAVAELNNQILDLIGLYPELAKYVDYINGRYIISDEGKEFLGNKQKDALQSYQNAQTAQQIADNIVKREENQAATNQVSLTRHHAYTAQEYARKTKLEAELKNTEDGSEKQKKINSELNDIEAAEYFRYQNSEKSFYNAVKDRKEDISNYFKSADSFNEFVDSLTNLDQGVKEAIKAQGKSEEYRNALLNKLQTQANLDESNRLTTQVIGTTGIKQEYGNHITKTIQDIYAKANREITNFDAKNLGDKFAGVIANVADAGGQALDAAYTNLKKYRGNDKWSNGELEKYLNDTGYTDKNGNAIKINNDIDLYKTWLKETKGWTNEDLNDLHFGNGNNQGKYRKGKDADWQTSMDEFGVNDQKMREDLAQRAMAQDLLNNAGIEVNNLDEWIEKLTKIQDAAYDIGWGFGTNFSDAVLESLTTGDFNLAEEALEISPEEYQGIMSMTGDAIADAFGVDSAIAEAAGFSGEDAAAAWGEAFQQELKKQWSAEEFFQHQIDKIGEEASAADLDSKVIQDYAKYINEAADEVKGLDNSLTDNIEKSGKVAVSMGKLNKGLQSLADDFNDAKTAISENTAGTQAYSEAIGTLRTDLASMLNVSEDYIDNDFITGHMEDMEKAINGDAKAIDRLQMAMAQEAIIKISATIVDPNTNEVISSAEQQKLIDAVNGLTELIPDINIEVGTEIDTAKFNSAVQDILTTSGMTAEKAREIFSSMSLDVDFETETQHLTHMVPSTTKLHQIKNFKLFDGGIAPSWEEVETVLQPTYTEVTEDVEVPKMDVNGGAKVNGITKIRSGGIASKPTVKNSGGSSGGKSGKDKTPKKLSNEIDRYHEVNEVLDDLSKKLDRINTDKDRAFGGKHLAAIDAEIAALEEYSNTLDDKIKENLKYLSQDKGLAEAYGAIFDENGRITNYNEIIANAVQQYNNGSIDDDQYSSIKSALDKYTESLNMAEDLTEEKAEYMRKILDANFEKVEYTVEINLKITDFDNKILDWELNQLEDRDFKSAEKIGLYSKKADTASKNYDTYKEAIKKGLNAAGASAEQIDAYFNGDITTLAELENLTTQMIEDIGEWTEGMMEQHDTLLEMKKTIEEELIHAWEEYNDKIEESLDLYDHLKKKVSFFKDVSDILGLKRLGLTAEAIDQMNLSQLNVQKNYINSLKDQYEMNKKDYEVAIRERANATSEEDIAHWDKVIKNTNEKMIELEDNILDNGQELLNNIKQDFEDFLDNVFDEFEDQMAGIYTSFEDMTEAFDQGKTLKEEYLPEYEKLYELNKMNRNLNKEISKLNNVGLQQRLRDLQEEINDLQANNVEMSKYDLEYLQKKYDLRLAEIALEEAQNNKNQVRLTRDTSGNYNYVYTADQNQIDDSAQKYEDALYSAQKTSEDYITSTSESLLSLQNEFVEKLKEIWKNWEEGLLTTEERDAKIKQVNEFYTTQFKYINSELDKALGNNVLLYNNEYLEFANSRDLIKLKGNEFTKYFSDTLLSNILDDYQSLQDYMDNYLIYLGSVDSKEGAMGKIAIRADDMETYINDVLQLVANTDMSNFAIDSKRELDKVDDEVKELSGWITTLSTVGSNAFDVLSKAVTSKQSTITGSLSTIRGEVNLLSGAYSNLIKTIAGIETKYGVKKIDLSKVQSVSDLEALAKANSGDDDAYGGNGGKWILESDDSGKGTFKTPQYYVTSNGIATGINGSKERYIIIDPSLKASFATGGYTGSWGDEGKLAVLHEKELILNKQDTENMLSAVKIVRQLSDILELNKINLNKQLVNTSSIQHLINNSNNSNDSVEQNININANFPGVTARQEIEQAFMDLANNAVSYIHKY